MAGNGTENIINLTLNVWRQKNRNPRGSLKPTRRVASARTCRFSRCSTWSTSALILEGKEPIAFDHDCREGICGQCGVVVNGEAHGPRRATTTCQLHMRSFHNGEVLTIEPWRAAAFPVVKDLMVDRSAFDRIIASGGFISVRTGNAPEANDLPVAKDKAELSMDGAACIACGACVAACPNASAMLFVSAKVGHLNTLPQGEPEKYRRATAMIDQMDAEGFGSCTNHGECEAVCPKEISMAFIALMNRDYLRASIQKVNRPTQRARSDRGPLPATRDLSQAVVIPLRQSLFEVLQSHSAHQGSIPGLTHEFGTE